MKYPTIKDRQLDHFKSYDNGAKLIPFPPLQIPFAPANYFVVIENSTGSLRGRHAHIKTTQLMICLNGSISVICKDLYRGISLDIIECGKSILVPPMVWSEEIYHRKDTSLLVFWDHCYDKKDYIRNWQDFISYREKTCSIFPYCCG